MNVRIDRKRKLPATTFLMALPDEDSEQLFVDNPEGLDPSDISGMSREEILALFMVLPFTQKQKMVGKLLLMARRCVEQN